MHRLTSFIFIVWAIFWIYWIISSFGSKRNSTLNGVRGARVRVPILLVIIVISILARAAGGITYNDLSIHVEVVRIIGLVLFLSGLALAIWARLYLGKNWGMPMSQKEDPELVTNGPYKFVRHPIYSGILLAIIGTALSVNLYWLLILAFAATSFIYSATQEEKYMTKEFPKQYASYKSTSKMLIPYIF